VRAGWAKGVLLPWRGDRFRLVMIRLRWRRLAPCSFMGAASVCWAGRVHVARCDWTAGA